MPGPAPTVQPDEFGPFPPPRDDDPAPLRRIRFPVVVPVEARAQVVHDAVRAQIGAVPTLTAFVGAEVIVACLDMAARLLAEGAALRDGLDARHLDPEADPVARARAQLHQVSQHFLQVLEEAGYIAPVAG